MAWAEGLQHGMRGQGATGRLPPTLAQRRTASRSCASPLPAALPQHPHHLPPPPPPLACLEVDDHEEDGHGGQQLHDVGQALAVESVLQGRGVGGGEGCKKGRGGGARGGGGGPPAGLMLQAGRAERPQGSQRKCEALAQARRCKQPSLP